LQPRITPQSQVNYEFEDNKAPMQWMFKGIRPPKVFRRNNYYPQQLEAGVLRRVDKLISEKHITPIEANLVRHTIPVGAVPRSKDPDRPRKKFLMHKS